MKNIGRLNLLCFVVLFSCGKSSPTLDDIDLKIWITDKKGCLGQRSSMKNSLDAQKNKLLGLSEVQIVELLGNPDHNELYKRNQKFYYYFIQPSSECNGSKFEDSAELVIRFNAIGLSNDVSIE